jgi:hypothetical protein
MHLSREHYFHYASGKLGRIPVLSTDREPLHPWQSLFPVSDFFVSD